MKTMTSATTIIKRYKNGGTIETCIGFKYEGADYSRVYACCKHFAKQGKRTVILPKIHKKDPLYKEIYGDLIGTKYENKCPDFLVGNKFYEHEGFISKNQKNVFRNMISRGIKQSSRIVIDDCGVPWRWAEKNIRRRIEQGTKISEVWVLKSDGALDQLF